MAEDNRYDLAIAAVCRVLEKEGVDIDAFLDEAEKEAATLEEKKEARQPPNFSELKNTNDSEPEPPNKDL